MTSPSPFVQSAAARAQMVPFAGTRMKEAVGATQRAAGQEVTDIAEQALGGQGAAAQSAAAGRAQNALYNKVWPNIDPNVQYSMPRTQAAISKVKARRQEANWADPGQGLDKFERAAQGSTARGAHMTHSEERAKIADYDAGKATPNAGYARGDWNTILGAMREDTRHMIGGAAFQKATGQGYTRQQAQIAAGRTVADYDAAQSQFGRLAGRRRFLTKLENRVGSDANVLYQLGRNDATGRFSLDKFVTEWNKMPQRRRDQLFDKGHQDAIKEIVDMGEHIKGALRDVNTSHTAGALLTFDLAKDAVMLTLAAGSHLAGSGLEHAMEPSLMGTGGATASIATALMFHWMARPDIARSLSSWTKAYRSLYKEQTPIRRAAFMAATRNLSKNINVPVENLIRQGHAWATGQYPDHPEVE
jgi:hypothetical protein